MMSITDIIGLIFFESYFYDSMSNLFDTPAARVKYSLHKVKERRP